MTIFSSKKPSNTTNNKDLSSNSTNQQQQSQTSSSSSLTISRQRLSRDDETTSNTITNNPNNLIEEANLGCDSSLASSSSTNNILTTTAPISFNSGKRKSHHHHHHPTTVKQARRRRGSVGENLLSNSSGSNVACNSPSSSLTIDNNPTSSSNLNEHPVAHASTSASSLTTVNNDDADQCNSEDEYEQTTVKYDRNNLDELEMRFARALKEKKGFVIKPIKEDGACLFRAVSDQVFGDEEMHATVRQNCMDYIVKNADFFRSYITEDFDHYVTRKRRQHCHGNHIEMIALSELYNRPIEVYEYSIEPINTVHGMYQTDNEPIRLSYHCGVHYNSVVDPWRPTAGLGLGLPDLEPGHAQESLIRTALRQSEESHLERAMLDDKLAATDWEATQEELIQQVARESYLQWLCDTNQQHKDSKMMSSSSSSSTSVTTSERATNVDHASSPRNLLPLRLDERKDCEFALPFQYEVDARTNADLVDDDDDDDEDSIMRRVLAISQIEYVESLKKHQKPPNSDDPNGPSSSSDAHLL